MTDRIKTVTDQSQFGLLFENFFKGAPAFIKTNSGNIEVQYLGYNEGKVVFKIPLIKSSPENVVVVAKRNANTIYLSLKYVEKSEDVFVFIPVKFQILSELRKEERTSLDSVGGKDIIYLNNLITDYIIERSLAAIDRKIDKIKDFAEYELKKRFDHVKIAFINENKQDNRLRHIKNTSQAIYMPNLNVDPEKSEEDMYNHYINYIYRSDISISSRNKYIAEITVPIVYNNVIIYGYIQVNSTQPIGEDMFEYVKKMCAVVNHLMVKQQMLIPLPDKFLLADISHSGLSFVFKEKKFLRYFEEGSRINFDILFPADKKAVIGAVIRNIRHLENMILKVGCEIFDMDDTSRMNYEEFVQLFESDENK
ncbi:MAG: PilZ domain-containing protein [Spirochaetes bacterium]|nr:PilZ domain-containing protein [Spirochaetota bacterium]